MGGETPIPWTAINQYSSFYEFDEEQDELLHFFMRKMDHAFMKWSKKKNGDKQKSGPIRSKNGSGFRKHTRRS